MLLQPCDWYEHDVGGKYTIDVFGRTDKQKVACVRITGFKPYFYVSSKQIPSTSEIYERANKKWDVKFGPQKGQQEYAYKLSKKIFEFAPPELAKVKRYDVMNGFQELGLIDVWKVTCGSHAIFQAAKQVWKYPVVQYESNLHPFLRLFHERHLGPASPIQANNAELLDVPLDENDEPLYQVDEFYSCDYNDISPAEASIPMLVASYDLEMYSASGNFPQAKNDRDAIIQIGVSYRWSHKLLDPALRVVYVLGEVTPSEDESIEFISCQTEAELLTEFMEDIKARNPDILCGYNIFGFDDAYIEGRCQKYGINFDVSRKRAEFRENNFETKNFELASGKYDLRMLSLRGRLGLDLLLNMRREHSLASFKLDDVASVFLRGKVLDYANKTIKTKSTRGLSNGNYVRFELVGNTLDPLYDGQKFEVYNVQPTSFQIKSDIVVEDFSSMEWTFSKDDVDHIQLFELHAHGGPDGRAKIAKYCIQDCDLVLNLMAKLDTIVNARGMADVCKVPMDYVLQRGQGIKIFSAVLYYASQRNQIIRVQENAQGDTGYEGAIVLPPKIGMYLDQPISVLDFNSLYPTNMIAYNLSPDTLVSVREFNEHGQKIRQEGYDKKEFTRLEEAGYVLDEIEYDIKQEGKVVGKTICTYIQKNPDQPMTEGILPKTLDILLKKRKEFKEKMEDKQYDEAQRSVFNGLQLAYKVVANSVYGQTGSRTSPIRKLCVAASTTAAGRKALNLAKHIAETEYNAEVIYGDTDSIFIKFPTRDLSESIRLGIDAGKKITSACRRPYKIAYEKTFYPFILFCRKRYIGMMYEEDASAKPKRKEMGIPLKRRDNAPIVKEIYGGALDMILKERDIRKAQQFVNNKLVDVLENRIPLEKFIVSKSLRDDYAAMEEGYTGTATLPAHRVLADRMAQRDPGTAPKVGERIQYIYVAENSKAAKQGDKIEEVSYVRKKGLHPDAVFYITNQIQNPVSQLFALCIEQLDGYVPPRKVSYGSLMDQMMEKYNQDEEEATKAVLDKKADQLEEIMFLGSRTLANIVRKNTRGPMDKFFKRV